MFSLINVPSSFTSLLYAVPLPLPLTVLPVADTAADDADEDELDAAAL